MPNSIETKKGYKTNYTGVPWDSIPIDERFNPYDYISQDNYKSTKRGQAAYAEDLARLQYLADLRQQDWQNAYNEAQLADARDYDSYANQVALMREAGLNPDLLGVSAGSSSPLTSSSGPSASGGINPMAGMPTVGDTARSVISIIGTVAQTAVSLYSGGLSLSGQILSNTSSLFSLVSSIYKDSENVSGTSLDSGFTSSLPVSRSQKRILERFYSKESSTERFLNNRYKVLREGLKNRNEFEKSRLNPFEYPFDFNGDDSINQDDWSYVWRPIFEAQASILQNELDSRKKRSVTDIDRADFEDSELDYLSTLKEPFKQVLQRMKSKYDEGSDFWGYAISVLYVLLNSSMSFSNSKKSGSSFSFGVQ